MKTKERKSKARSKSSRTKSPRSRTSNKKSKSKVRLTGSHKNKHVARSRMVSAKSTKSNLLRLAKDNTKSHLLKSHQSIGKPIKAGIKILSDSDFSVAKFSVPTTESDIKQTVKRFSEEQIAFDLRKGQFGGFSFLKYSSPRLLDTRVGDEEFDQELLSNETPTEKKWPYDYRIIICKNIKKNELQQCLNKIFPPKEWTINGDTWRKTVSVIPASRTEVIKLKEDFETLLKKRNAKVFGLCSIRLDLYLQCFDELIRQSTICCTERGLLMAKVRDTIKSTLLSYHSVYESSVALGFRKTLNHEEELASLSDSIGRIIKERNVLRNKIVETDAKIDTVRQFIVTHTAQEEIKHQERMILLRKANELLKAALMHTAEHGPKKKKAPKNVTPTASKAEAAARALKAPTSTNKNLLAVPGT